MNKKRGTRSVKRKTTKQHKEARVIRKLNLNLSILEKQRELWTLRAKAKKFRIAEVKREIRTRSGRN